MTVLDELQTTEARLQALRHQLDNHFLFNSLNSVAALIASGEARLAERMVENLADFVRETGEVNALSDIRLEREFELARLYLSVEQVRFADRLVAGFGLPSELAEFSVPALILQPLVENSVRHAVARSSRPVKVLISAARDGNVLRLSVEDDGAQTAGRASEPSGIGIANVMARLRARYEDQAGIIVEPRPAGGFSSSLAMPLGRKS